MKKRIAGIFIILLCIHTVHSKRLEPKPIEPIRIGTYIYSIPHFTQRNIGGVLREENIETHTVSDYVLYKVYKNPLIEGDAQDVFFTSMEYLAEEHVLKLIDEKNGIYMFDLKTKRLKGAKGVVQKYGFVALCFCILFTLPFLMKKSAARRSTLT